MRSTKSKVKHKNGLIIADGKAWTKEEYKRFRVYQTKFNKERYRMYGFRLIKGEDDDLIKFLDSKEKLNPYIVGLIKKDMAKHK